MTQGSYANSSGNTLEKTVKEVFMSKGFQLLPYSKWNKTKDKEKFGKELLLTGIPYTSIYNHPGTTEFFASSEKYDFKIRIECKWQQSAGSVDEKFPYLYLNCIEAMPEEDIIIIVDGGGYKKGGLEWLKKAAKEKKYQGQGKNITVFSLTEFIAWANRNLR